MERSGRVGAAFMVAAGLVASTYLLTSTWERIKSENSIAVTGSAKRRIRSDLIVWKARVSVQMPQMSDAFRALASQTPKVVNYLKNKKINGNQISVGAISTRILHPMNANGVEMQDTISGYALYQTIEVRSNEVDKLTQISKQATELINEGVNLESEAPEYYYTKVSELKVKMMAEAARDAHNRAKQIVAANDTKLGQVRSARMGVIQINPANATYVSSEGNNDNTSLEKDIIAVVSTTYALK